MQLQVSLSELENFLQLTSTREQMIATNMANVDTPGYRTRDIDFERELQRAIFRDAGGEEPRSGFQLEPMSEMVSGLLERPDGNNVSLDREGLLLAETQLQHQLGVQLIKRHFHLLLSAINGGGQ